MTKHSCGLFAVIGHTNAPQLVRLGLQALQHRGEESAGIAYVDPRLSESWEYPHPLLIEKTMGLVSSLPTSLAESQFAIGHVRYSTTGSSCSDNIQPMMNHKSHPNFALAHNGNITNAKELRDQCKGLKLETSTDSEPVLRLIQSRCQPAVGEIDFNTIGDVLNIIEGAYCFIMLSQQQFAATRDPHGFHPLCLGEFEGSKVIASESCALDAIGARYIRDIHSGEIYTIDLKSGEEKIHYFGNGMEKAQCVFELVYFADPASNIFDENVHVCRKAMGKILGEEFPVEADIIAPVPHSGIDASIGYSETTDIPYGRVFTTNNYSGRSFIMPEQSTRELKVKTKLHVIKEVVKDKRVCIIEDSVVRGTTVGTIVKVLREAGASEVHLRVASPPIRHPCYFGIDFPDVSKLAATGKLNSEICAKLNLDSLGYLSLRGMMGCVKDKADYCTACFSGDYCVEVDSIEKECFEDAIH